MRILFYAMKIQTQLILAVFIVNFGLTTIQSHNQTTNQVQRLLDSIVKSDREESEIYRKNLIQEVVREQQEYNTMKKELWAAKIRKENQKINFYKKSHIGENIEAIKRERNERDTGADMTRLISDTEGIQKEFMDRHPCDWNRDIVWEQMDHLTRESHKKICDHLLPSVATPIERDHVSKFRYVELPPHVNIKSVRFIDRAVLPIPECVPVPRIPVLECHYKEKKFYVTHADDKHVFNLERAPHTEIIFNLAGLIIPIDYEKLSIA